MKPTKKPKHFIVKWNEHMDIVIEAEHPIEASALEQWYNKYQHGECGIKCDWGSIYKNNGSYGYEEISNEFIKVNPRATMSESYQDRKWWALRIAELKETGLYPGNLAWRYLARGARRKYLEAFEQWVIENNLPLGKLPII